MKYEPSLALLALLGPLGVIAACAEGTTPDLADLAPAQTIAPTEPPGESLPPKTTASSGAPTGEDDSGATSHSSASSDASSSSSDASSSSTSSSSTSSSAGGIDAGPSCVTVAPSNVCGLTPQCGCAANQTCDVTTKTTGAVSCSLAGGGPRGSLCTKTTQCGLGLTCAYGACRPYCATANTACTGAGLGQCGQLYNPPGTAVPNAKVCTITCDLRNPTAACGSNTCIWDSGVGATDCDAAGTKALYEPCTSYNDCRQGLNCAKHPAFGFECERWCRVGTNSDCSLLETCKDVYGAAAPMQGATKLGLCR